MSIGAFCNKCNSACCNHCLQINEHNMRMKSARSQAGMQMSLHEYIMSIEPSSGFTVATQESKNKKLLLLRRGK